MRNWREITPVEPITEGDRAYWFMTPDQFQIGIDELVTNGLILPYGINPGSYPGGVVEAVLTSWARWKKYEWNPPEFLPEGEFFQDYSDSDINASPKPLWQDIRNAYEVALLREELKQQPRGTRGTRGTRAPGDDTYRLTVGAEIVRKLRADPDTPAYLSYIEIDGANEKLNIYIGSTPTDISTGTDLSSQWETAGYLGILNLTPLEASSSITLDFQAPFDTDSAAPYTNLKEIGVSAATDNQSQPRTIILDDNAVAPSFSDNTGDAQTWDRYTTIAPVVIPQSTGGVPAPVYTSSGVPAGITVFPPTTNTPGVITGTPTSRGSGTITVTATNSEGSATWTIAYNTTGRPDAVAPTVTIGAVATGDEGTTVRLSAALGSGGVYDALDYLWSVTGGTLNNSAISTPTWTRPPATVDTTYDIDLVISVRGTGTDAARNTSDFALAATRRATVRHIPVITTDVDEIFRLAAMQPATPTGGTSTLIHTPTGWTRSEPNPTQTKVVWLSQRTRSYADGLFTSASAWGPSAPLSYDLWLAGRTPDRIYRSKDNGSTWSDAITGPSGQTFTNGIAVAPNGDLWLAGDTPDRIYRSKDNGSTWSDAIRGPSGQSLISGIAVAPNGDLWLAGSTRTTFTAPRITAQPGLALGLGARRDKGQLLASRLHRTVIFGWRAVGRMTFIVLQIMARTGAPG